MTGKKRYSRRWTRLIGGLLGLGIVWGFYVSRTSDKEIGAASLHEAKRLFEYTELLPSVEGEISSFILIIRLVSNKYRPIKLNDQLRVG